MADTTADPWGTVPSAGIPEDGELEQTGVPPRDPNAVSVAGSADDEKEDPSLKRFNEIMREAMDSPENARSGSGR